MSTSDLLADRFLEEGGMQSSDIPLLVLFVLTVVFCCLWGPSFCRTALWYCGMRQDFNDRRRDPAEVIRVSLPNLNMFTMDPALGGAGGLGGLGGMSIGMGAGGPPMPLWRPMRSMTLEDRREFVENILVSRKIIKVCEDGPEDGEEMKDMSKAASENTSEDPKKTSSTAEAPLEAAVTGKTLMLVDVVNENETTTFKRMEPCPICLGEYEEGDILCWSQNSSCQHAFHKECAIEWLMSHEECPLCRQNYLSLDGEDGEDAITPRLPPVSNGLNPAESDAYAYLRGVHLFQLLSRLQTLADARPNTTIRLEGVELANGQRGNMEIQQATTDNSMIDVNGRGLNVRVTTREGADAIDQQYVDAEEGIVSRRRRRRRTRPEGALTDVPGTRGADAESTNQTAQEPARQATPVGDEEAPTVDGSEGESNSLRASQLVSSAGSDSEATNSRQTSSGRDP